MPAWPSDALVAARSWTGDGSTLKALVGQDAAGELGLGAGVDAVALQRAHGERQVDVAAVPGSLGAFEIA